MSKDNSIGEILDQVASTRRKFLKRVVAGSALALLAVPASAILKAQPQDDQGKGKGDEGDGDGKGDGKGKGKGKGDGDAPPAN